MLTRTVPATSDVSETDLVQIRTSLQDEYSDDDIEAMLFAASFMKDADGVTVTYDNGARDRFEYVKVLVHKLGSPAPSRD